MTAFPRDVRTAASQFAEPLEASAPIAWALAPDLCGGDPGDVDCCRWYHQAWQYLRLVGVMASIRADTTFLLDTFGTLAPTGDCRRVLISGAADYGMLAHLACAYASRPLEVSVLDRCRTPLMLNRWYAGRIGLVIDTRQEDLFEETDDAPYDLACTHNLLGHFSPGQREALVHRWQRSLRPGGLFVTTQRVEPFGVPESMEDAGARARTLARRVEIAAARRRLEGPDAAALSRAAYEGWRRRPVRHPIRSMTEIANLFTTGGFDILVADEGAPSAADAPDVGTRAKPGTYRMRLVARRK
jgi:hypothetical protein